MKILVLLFFLSFQASSKDFFKTPLKTPTVIAAHFVTLDGKTLYEKNKKKLLRPASLLKVLSTAVALEILGPTRTFDTKIYTDGKIINGQLKGNLYIVGNGAPLITSEKLWQLAADIKHLGIGKISGNLIIDKSIFDRIKQADLRVKSSQHSYDAKISAFGVNFNNFVLSLSPGKVGQKARISFDPYPLYQGRIINKTKTVKHKGEIKLSRIQSNPPKFLVKGSISKNAKLQKIYRRQENPDIDCGQILLSFFKGQGIGFKGKIQNGITPTSARLIAKIPGEPVQRIVHLINQYSNNYVTDMLIHRLGAEFNRPGIQVIKSFLAKKLGMKNIKLKDSSGLYPESYLSAQQLTKVLRYMSKQWQNYPYFHASLPLAGKNGSLKNRFKKQAIKIRAKTGSRREPVHAVGLAGYGHHPQYGNYAFALIYNGVNKKPQPNILDMRLSQEEGLTALHHHFDKLALKQKNQTKLQR